MAATEQPLTRVDFDRCHWEDVIAGSAEKECFAYACLFFGRAQQARDAGDDVAAAVFAVLGIVTDVGLREKEDQPFAPRFIGTVARGTSPDDLTTDQYEILTELAPGIADAEMRARTCDLIWVMRRNYKLAKIAVDAYIESAKIWEDPKDWVYCAVRIGRAIRLARSIRGGAEAEYRRAIAYAEDLLLKLNGEDPLFLSAQLMELLQGVKEGDPLRYAALAEKAAARAEAEGGPAFDRARIYWDLAADWYAQGRDETRRESARIAAAETHVKWAEGCTRQPPQTMPYLNAARQLELAYHALLKVGTPTARTRAADVYRQLVEVQKKSVRELLSFSHTVDLTDPAKAAEDTVAGKTLLEALVQLGSLAQPAPMRRFKERAEEQLRRPLIGLFSAVKLGDTGKIIATRPHFESNPEGAELAIVAESYQLAVKHYELIATAVILPAIHKIASEHHVREQDFFRIVSSSCFVPDGREMTFTKGLYAGFTGDLIGAVHLLIPQIEQSIRMLLEAHGAITSGFNHQARQNEYDLNRTLYMEELKQIYDEDTIFTLKGLLVEHPGANMRNFVAHGLLNDGQLNSYISLYIWAMTLRLCIMRPPTPATGA